MRNLLLTLALAGATMSAQAVKSAAAAPVPDKSDPQYQAKGDQKRTYAFPETGEKIGYHLFVPSKWDKNAKLPLVVVLHGMGQSEDAPFERGEGVLGKMAEQRGFVVVAPVGYRPSGGYGDPFPMVAAPRQAGGNGGGGGGAAKGGGAKGGGGGGGRGGTPLTAEDRQRSEQDVLYVADLVAKEYNADPKRIYLMGNSMGGNGTWYLGEKYPSRWAAISPSDGPVADAEYPYDNLKTLPVLVVHGDADTVASFDASKAMVETAKSHGVNAEFLPVKDGDHYLSWTMVVPQIFDFFDKHPKK